MGPTRGPNDDRTPARPRLWRTTSIHQARLAPDEVTTHDGIRVTTPARTLLDLAAILTPHDLERAATRAEIHRLGSPTSLEALAARYPRRPGTPAIRRLLASGAIGRTITKAELEHRFIAFLDANRLPRPRTNHRIRLHDDPNTLAADLRTLLESEVP